MRVRELEDALTVGRETARFSPGRRSARNDLDRYERSARQIDYAVRNTRVLARHVLRYLRAGGSASPELTHSIRDLAAAVWALGAVVEDPAQGAAEVRRHAARASRGATRSYEADRELRLAEIVAQVRSTSVDLVRAAEAAGATDGAPQEQPSEELLLADAREEAPV